MTPPLPPKPIWNSKFKLKNDVWVYIPTEESKSFGKYVKSTIEKLWIPPPFFYHLKSGGHVNALKTHKANKFFIHLDIKSFYNQVNRSKITRCLKPYLGYELARDITSVSTVKLENDHCKYGLPFGFIQSPILASLCLHKSRLGKLLSAINQGSNAEVSVYVDDIIISSNSIELLRSRLDEIKTAANLSGFSLNEKKEQGPAELIEAFNIELSFNNTEIEKERLNKLVGLYKQTDNENVKNGINSYINSINPQQLPFEEP